MSLILKKQNTLPSPFQGLPPFPAAHQLNILKKLSPRINFQSTLIWFCSVHFHPRCYRAALFSINFQVPNLRSSVCPQRQHSLKHYLPLVSVNPLSLFSSHLPVVFSATFTSFSMTGKAPEVSIGLSLYFDPWGSDRMPGLECGK